MRKVLCLFYYFPPSGGAGALRCLATVRHLLDHGWKAVVVAPRGSRYSTPGEDLLALIPQEVEVHRTACPDLRRPLGLLRRLGIPNPLLSRMERTLLVPDSQIGWAPFAWAASRRLLAGRGFDAVLSWGDPWTAHLLGARLALDHGLPFVAAFADEWSTNAYVRELPAFHRGLHRRLERRVLSRAAAATVINGPLRTLLEAAHPDLDPDIDTAGNGYEEEDFRGRTGRLAERFTLLTAGSHYSRTSADVLVDALGILLARRSGWRPRVRLRVLGFHTADFARRVRLRGLSDVVGLEGARPHAESVQAMLDAHALALTLTAEANVSHAQPVRLFEYLRAGRSVLGFCPDGEAASLLERSEGCVRLQPGDAQRGSHVLEAWIARWERGDWPSAPIRREGIGAFSRAAQVARLAAVLDRAAARGPARS